MDTSDPHIYFDENGISNHYWDFLKFSKPNLLYYKNGLDLLEKEVEKIKNESKGKDFDCILGLSGGMDSSFMLHTMVTKYNLKPLVFHVDGGWNTELAVNNINNLVDKLGLDLFTEVIDWNEMKEFQLAMFKSGVPHIDIPQDMAFFAVLYKFAQKYNVKTILNGGNIATESVLRPFNLIYYGGDLVQIKDILKKNSSFKLKTFPLVSIFYKKIWLRIVDNIKVFKPLNYLNFNKKEAEQILSSKYDWKPYSQKHFESRFTRFYEGYWLTERFNFDMRRTELSSLILSNQISRKQALTILKKPPLEKSFVKKEFNYIATKLGISEDELFYYFKMPKMYYWDYANNKNFLEIGEKFINLISPIRRGGAF